MMPPCQLPLYWRYKREYVTLKVRCGLVYAGYVRAHIRCAIAITLAGASASYCHYYMSEMAVYEELYSHEIREMICEEER